MTIYHKTCRCGAQFEARNANTTYCPDCREARYNAAHPLKVCRVCGKENRTMGRNQSSCAECRAARDNAEMEERQRQQSYSERRKAYLKHVSKLSAAEQAEHFSILLKWIISALADAAEEVVEVNPEQVGHSDQDAIDAAFRSLMDGVL